LFVSLKKKTNIFCFNQNQNFIKKRYSFILSNAIKIAEKLLLVYIIREVDIKNRQLF